MDANERDLTQVVVLRLIFDGHEEEERPLEELHLGQSRVAHVEEDSVEYGHRDVRQERREEDGESDGEENQQIGHPLLTNSKKCGFLPWSSGFRVHFE